jgi:predicted lipoprotein with Yx(FWY)xxD motif
MNRKSSRFAVALSVIALALTGCAGSTTDSGSTGAPDAGASSAPPAASTPAAASPDATGTADLAVATSSLGDIVVDAKGMTLYVFDKDTAGSGTSACAGQCLVNWPPLHATSDTPKVDGVTGEVGTITGTDGQPQVTLNGLPLYYFVGDAAAGDVNGQALQSIWWVVAPSGEAIH